MEQPIFKTSSGNVARVPAMAVGADHTSIAVNWANYPSAEDQREFNEWFLAQHPELRRIRESRDVSRATEEEIARRMLQFAQTGRLSLPEEN